MNIEELEEFKSVVCELLKESKKFKKLSEKSSNPELSPKQSEKARTDTNWQAMHVKKLKYKAHALAVDVGIADVREPVEYETVIFNPSSFHAYEYTPDKPKCLKG
ncbi:hypothetical protein [Sessilibacter corallicola]|uniref:hypothetical protein n=1 Tax=Sessilibacter corallicola TaxID=2904075 RepID=UPI001E34DDF3|nr:hypothetical protein [Sessilibacter corallicola]MCE2029271.1 hypothetical protein [Sessilibacter corallicola]